MNNFYVYFHINSIKKEIFYVGKGKEKRAYSFKRNKFYNNYIEKYGIPKVIIIHKNITEKYAIFLEKFYIKLIGRRDLNTGPLVNLTHGGDGTSGHIHTKESKRKMSKSSKGKKCSKETREKLSNTLKNRKFSITHRKKLSNIAKKRKHSKETKLKMSNGHKNKKHSEETKLKMSESQKKC